MADYEITCIETDETLSPQQRVIRIGGTWPLVWSMDVAQAIRRIKAGEDRFYIQRVRALNIFLIVDVDAAGQPFLKAPGEGDTPRMLQSLPTAKMSDKTAVA